MKILANIVLGNLEGDPSKNTAALVQANFEKQLFNKLDPQLWFGRSRLEAIRPATSPHRHTAKGVRKKLSSFEVNKKFGAFKRGTFIGTNLRAHSGPEWCDFIAVLACSLVPRCTGSIYWICALDSARSAIAVISAMITQLSGEFISTIISTIIAA